MADEELQGPEDDQEARAQRADQLREEIERLKSGDADEPPKSPHEFVEERMRELEQEDEEESDAPGP